MLRLSRSSKGAILIRPRWPYGYVHIAEDAYNKLIAAQSLLAEKNIALVLTRGFENEGIVLRIFHHAARRIGALLFILLFPARCGEAKDIFSANGHNQGGTCIDVGIVCGGQRLICLPRGVFTSKIRMDALYRQNRHAVDAVRQALRASGFSLHPNATEALQIHCEC